MGNGSDFNIFLVEIKWGLPLTPPQKKTNKHKLLQGGQQQLTCRGGLFQSTGCPKSCHPLERRLKDSAWYPKVVRKDTLETVYGCGSKLKRRGKPQVLVHVSTCQGSILEFRFFEPQPCQSTPLKPPVFLRAMTFYRSQPAGCFKRGGFRKVNPRKGAGSAGSVRHPSSPWSFCEGRGGRHAL